MSVFSSSTSSKLLKKDSQYNHDLNVLDNLSSKSIYKPINKRSNSTNNIEKGFIQNHKNFFLQGSSNDENYERLKFIRSKCNDQTFNNNANKKKSSINKQMKIMMITRTW